MMEDIVKAGVEWVVVAVVPVIAVYCIRYLHVLIQKTKFARNSDLDDMVFNVLLEEAGVFANKIRRMEEAGEDGVEEFKSEAAANVLLSLKARMADQGISIVKKYSENALSTMLHAAVQRIKKSTGNSSS